MRRHIFFLIILLLAGSALARAQQIVLQGNIELKGNITLGCPLGLTITNFSPASAAVGENVLISGGSFGTGVGGVMFGSVAASILSWTDDGIVVTVPAGATSGKVRVSAHGVCGSADYTLGTPGPRITGLLPDSGGIGTQVVLTGTSFGNTPGSSVVTFNGVEAPVVEIEGVRQWTDTQIAVTVPNLAPGSVPVMVRREDGQRSNGVGFTIPLLASPTSIRITPETFAMVVGDTREVAVVDNFGRPVTSAMGASLDVTDPLIVQTSISPDGQFVVTALAAGTTTLTATYQALTAQAQLTVYATADLPPGTQLWSVPDEPGYTTIDIVQAMPAQNKPDIYSFQDRGDEGVAIRARTIEGKQLWSAIIAGTAGTPWGLWFASKQGPDAFGGVLAELGTQYPDPGDSALARFDGAAGRETWRYESPGSLDGNWAVHPDGTIYVTQITGDWPRSCDAALLALDGQTGLEKFRIPLPNSLDIDHVWNDPTLVYPPDVSPPMIDPDGNLNLQVGVHFFNGYWGDSKQENSVRLLRVSPEGVPSWQVLAETDCWESEGSWCAPYYMPGEVIPDGQGGLLAAWTLWGDKQAYMTHVKSSGNSEYQLPFQDFWRDRSLVLGENGTAFARMNGKFVSFNLANGAVNWTWQANNTTAEMIAATAGNGLVVRDGNQVARLNSSGAATYDTWTGNGIQYASGNRWLSLGSDEVRYAPGLAWAESSFAAADQERVRRAYHHYEFDLFLCAAQQCGGWLDVAYVYYKDNPEYQPNPSTNLSAGQILTIKTEAWKALNAAFAGYPIKFVFGEPTSNQVWVVGDRSQPCGQTRYAGAHVSQAFYLTIMEQAQWALGLQTTTPTQEVLEAIGKGIGNTAAHEFGHQLGIAGEFLDAPGFYEDGNCHGDENPSTFTGIGPGGVPIHWGQQAADIIAGKIYAP